MIYPIFNKFVNDRKGAVEIIESSIIYPIILSFISIAILLSMIIIRDSIFKEKIYTNARLILNQSEKNDFQSTENRIYKLKVNPEDIKVTKRIFKYSLLVENKINTERVNFSKFSKTVFFVREILEDLGVVNHIEYKIQDILKMGEKMGDQIKRKLQ